MGGNRLKLRREIDIRFFTRDVNGLDIRQHLVEKKELSRKERTQ
jgi:hypothetical protein